MIAWLIACAGGEVATPSPEPSPIEVVDDSGLVEPDLPTVNAEPLQPTWTADHVAERLTEALGTIPNPAEVFQTYGELMRQGDGRCPGSETIIVDTWLYGCDASTGYSYAGVTDWLTGEYEVAGQWLELEGVAGDFWIDTPEDHRLEGGGNAVVLTNGDIWIGELAGSWQYTGGTDWFAHGFSGTMSLQLFPGLFTLLRGAIDVRGTHLAMHDLMLPITCDGGAQGALSLRDPNGGWYRLSFENCSPCGELAFEGKAIGEACIDFEPFMERIGGWL